MGYIAREEGFTAMYKGFWPAIHRQLVFASLRVGVYKQITEWIKTPGQTTVSLGEKILSGLVAGAVGITVANVSALRQLGGRSFRRGRGFLADLCAFL